MTDEERAKARAEAAERSGALGLEVADFLRSKGINTFLFTGLSPQNDLIVMQKAPDVIALMMIKAQMDTYDSRGPVQNCETCPKKEACDKWNNKLYRCPGGTA